MVEPLGHADDTPCHCKRRVHDELGESHASLSSKRLPADNADAPVRVPSETIRRLHEPMSAGSKKKKGGGGTNGGHRPAHRAVRPENVEETGIMSASRSAARGPVTRGWSC